MALPLPSIIPNEGPGGFVNNARLGLNALDRQRADTKYAEAKAEFAPQSLRAEAASKLAYSGLMGPQFVAKLFTNPEFLARTSREEKMAALEYIKNSVNNPAMRNALLMQQETQKPKSPANSIMDWLGNKLGIGGQQQQPPMNALAQMPQGNEQMQVPQNALMGPPRGTGTEAPIDTVGNEDSDEQYQIPPELRQQQPQQAFPQSGQTTGASPIDTGVEDIARYKGGSAYGEELGKINAKAVGEIGEEQKALSTAGATIDRAIGIAQNPEFQQLRDKTPFFQSTQLSILKKTGDEKQQRIIGDFVTSIQKMQGDAVNQFGGRAMQREFTYAEKLKINDDDTFGVMMGKLNALKTLKEISYEKNDMILDLMADNEMSLGKAIKIADKKIDISAIQKQTDKLLEKHVTLKNENGQTISLPESEVKAFLEKENG